MSNPWKRTDSGSTFTTWNASYGQGTAPVAPRGMSGRASPGQAMWSKRDPRSVSVPPGLSVSPSPASSAFQPIPTTPSRGLQPPSASATRPRLLSSPGRVVSASPSSRLPPSPHGLTPISFTFQDRPPKTPTVEVNGHQPPHIPHSLPSFRRQQSSPSPFATDFDEDVFAPSHLPEIHSPSKHPHPISASPSPQKMGSANVSPSSPPSRPGSSTLQVWKKGSDRPKTTATGRKPAYGV